MDLKAVVASTLLLPLTLGGGNVMLPNSCKGLSGRQWLKLLPDSEDTSYPAVNVECSNDYILLDYSSENNIESYFSSFVMWHYETAGPINGDTVNWEEWFLPNANSNDEYNYLISSDCDVCDLDGSVSNIPQLYSSKTTYWMTGNIFLCWWMSLGSDDLLCDLDYDTYQCYTCDVDESIDENGNVYYDNELTPNKVYDEISKQSFDSIEEKEAAIEEYYLGTGQCTTSIRKSNAVVPATHDDCSSTSDGYFKPSLGTNGRFCVCTQPTSDVEYYQASEDDITRMKENDDDDSKTAIKTENKEKEDDTSTKTSSNNIIELYQTDFAHGTYRIREPGTYKIMENIKFDFNSPSGEDEYLEFLSNNPQSSEYWFPRESQNIESEYPGAQFSRNEYHLGFFAGITIESDDVVLDLNGFELKQSDLFYYQQRWFSIIECSSSMFLPGTGPGFFGNAPKFATNTIIKNGIIGLTSHFGIHGNDNTNLILQDLIVRNFETHGIQFNGFSNIEMNNIEVGPTVNKNYLRAEYGHARIVLQRLKQVANEYPNEKISFYGRDEASTAASIAEELEYQMNLAFWYVNYKYTKNKYVVELFENGQLNENELFDENDASWQSAQKYFINENGLPLGGVLHGIYLNVASNTVSFLTVYKLYTPYHSSTAKLSNIKIHGLRHEMNEWVRLTSADYPAEVFMNPFGGPIDAEAALGGLTQDTNSIVDSLKYNGARVDSNDQVIYYGNIMTDAYLALNKLSHDDWGVIGVSLIGNDRLVSWAEGQSNLEDVLFGCNSDGMKHAGKGIIGLRMQGVKDITISDIKVYDLVDTTALGRMDCSDYETWDGTRGGGNFRQLKPMQVGFSGNMVQGINLNSVENVEFENSIEISRLTSYNGDVIGMAIWPANENVKFVNDNENELNVNIKELIAGYDIEINYNEINAYSRPNSAPQACGIIVYDTYDYNGKTLESTIEYSDSLDVNKQIVTSCVSGHLACKMTPFIDDEDATKTEIGSYNDDTSECSNQFVATYHQQQWERSSMVSTMKKKEIAKIKSNSNNKNSNNNNNNAYYNAANGENGEYKSLFNTDLMFNIWTVILFCIIVAGLTVYISMDCFIKHLLKKAVSGPNLSYNDGSEYRRLNETNDAINIQYGTA